MRSGRIRMALRTRSRWVTFPLTLQVRGAGFQTHHMVLLQLEFGGVFNRDDAFIVGDETREAFRRVVLPVPVPPVITMFRRAFTVPSRTSAIRRVIAPNSDQVFYC